ncbi:MAG TPA: hypothetical protein VM534_02380, partial [Thermoanaerobaculia bacterium]|nr:hypothetical protein [Thermoanaerobaculia bacterium]
MSRSLESLLTSIDAGRVPPVILVGGDNDYLVEIAWQQVRDRILEQNSTLQVEAFSETADLGAVIDSFKTHSLFGGRLLLVPELNAFVTAKELSSLLEKAINDWTTAKTDRKRDSSVAKLLHVLALVGTDLDAGDVDLAEALGLGRLPAAVSEMLTRARDGGKRISRGEGDAALLCAALAEGGAPGTVLLMRSGELPKDSATLRAIERAGTVVACDLTRNQFDQALAQALKEISSDYQVEIQPAAVRRLRELLGIERMMSEKRSSDVPDLRLVVTETRRLAASAGTGGVLRPADVEQQITAIGGGYRYEFGSLVSEGKLPEAVEKLRDLVAQSKREEPSAPLDTLYGRFIFALAEEVRLILAVHSLARRQGLDVRRLPHYTRFRDTLAEPLNQELRRYGLARQKLHPFVLYKKMEAAARYPEAQ